MSTCTRNGRKKMNIQAELHEISTYLINRKKYVDKELTKCPAGHLVMEKQHGKHTLVRSITVDGVRHRRNLASDEPEVIMLVRKELLRMEQRNLVSNWKALVHCGKHMKLFDHTIALHQISERFPILDSAITTQAMYDPDALEWETAAYEQYDYLPEEKRHTTSRGIKVRSKSELLIAEKLYDYSIPARYEQIIHLDGYDLAPDFTIRRADGKIFYWEHEGLTNTRMYLERQLKKSQIYAANNIVPWDNLIITYDNSDGNIDLRIITATIESRLVT